MSNPLFFRKKNVRQSSMKLENGSRVAVIGGGPAGSFFSYFLLDLAERVSVDLSVDIYEPRDFSLPAPKGCNMCAGVISETLVQNLATEGINLPASVVQKAINSYVLHTDMGSQRIEAAYREKRIGAIFRGGGPRGIQENMVHGFDAYLLSLAEKRGANIIPLRVTGVERADDYLNVRAHNGRIEEYELLVVAAGVNSAALKLFEEAESQYSPPKTTKTALREYFIGKAAIEKNFGDSLHVFLLDIPRLDFAMIIPKGDFVSVCLLGKEIDDELIQAVLTSPEMKRCFPEGWRWDQPHCQCAPRINTQAAIRPYADRLVFIGDSGVSRLKKDGIGAAYRTAKAASSCAIFEGISAEDFLRHYVPLCRTLELDNDYGRFIFFITHMIQRVGFFRKAMLQMVMAEQLIPGLPPRMSNVLWDTFTGSAPYSDVLRRTLHPAFISRFTSNLVSSAVGR